MAKQKIIEFKHLKQKKGQQGATINKILWDNNELKNYEPTILKMQKKELEVKEEIIDSKKKLVFTKSLKVENVYKPTEQIKKVIFPKTVNYMPTEEQEEEMKKE